MWASCLCFSLCGMVALLEMLFHRLDCFELVDAFSCGLCLYVSNCFYMCVCLDAFSCTHVLVCCFDVFDVRGQVIFGRFFSGFKKIEECWVETIQRGPEASLTVMRHTNTLSHTNTHISETFTGFLLWYSATQMSFALLTLSTSHFLCPLVFFSSWCTKTKKLTLWHASGLGEKAQMYMIIAIYWPICTKWVNR